MTLECSSFLKSCAGLKILYKVKRSEWSIVWNDITGDCVLPLSQQIVCNNLLYIRNLHFCYHFCRCCLFFLLYTLPCWNVQSRWSSFMSWMPWKPLLWTWIPLLYPMQQHNWVFTKSIANLPHKETVYAQWLLWNTHSVWFKQSGNLRDFCVLA